MDHTVLIDVRSSEEFMFERLASCMPGSALNVPLSTLSDRWFELPPPQSMPSWLWVVRDEAQAAELDATVRIRFDGPSPYPVHVLRWAESRDRLAVESKVVSGPFPMRPLWKPSPVLASAIEAIEAALVAHCVPTVSFHATNPFLPCLHS